MRDSSQIFAGGLILLIPFRFVGAHFLCGFTENISHCGRHQGMGHDEEREVVHADQSVGGGNVIARSTTY